MATLSYLHGRQRREKRKLKYFSFPFFFFKLYEKKRQFCVKFNMRSAFVHLVRTHTHIHAYTFAIIIIPIVWVVVVGCFFLFLFFLLVFANCKLKSDLVLSIYAIKMLKLTHAMLHIAAVVAASALVVNAHTQRTTKTILSLFYCLSTV